MIVMQEPRALFAGWEGKIAYISGYSRVYLTMAGGQNLFRSTLNTRNLPKIIFRSFL